MFEAGVGNIIRQPCATVDDVRHMLSAYASNGMESLAIDRVVVRGPFEVLRNGMRLVDLPGYGDMNIYRSRAAEDYMRTCSHVWIVIKATRSGSMASVRRMIEDRLADRMLGRCAVIVSRTDELYGPPGGRRGTPSTIVDEEGKTRKKSGPERGG